MQICINLPLSWHKLKRINPWMKSKLAMFIEILSCIMFVFCSPLTFLLFMWNFLEKSGSRCVINRVEVVLTRMSQWKAEKKGYSWFLYTAKKWYFLLEISLLNMNKSEDNCGLLLCRIVWILCVLDFQKLPSEVFCKKGVLRNFAKFTGKHLCQGLFFKKVAGLRPRTL